MNAQFIKGVVKNAIVFLLIGAVTLVFFTKQWMSVAAFICSGSLMTLNLWLLQRLGSNILLGKQSRSAVHLMIFGKFIILGVLIVSGEVFFKDNIIFYFLGLSLILPSAMVELLKSQVKKNGTS